MDIQNRSFSLDSNGILIPHNHSAHREDEYDEAGFDLLIKMQREHFWYRGRHALITKVFNAERSRLFGARKLRAIDMGGGCGGWVEYLQTHNAEAFEELALADSSTKALKLAESVVGPSVKRYQIDLLDLPWENTWDVVFLLDVLEHIPDHAHVLRQISKTLKPGGLIVITTPALQFFWTYNDEIVHHQRRYSKRDFRLLGSQAALDPIRMEYFMFFLSPALLASRLLFRPPAAATPEQLHEHLAKTHAIPAKMVNAPLTAALSLESALINRLSFPWGTSILAVLRKPAA
ncbi:MAG TPA: class I SAM-dependent methyltransferase [Herpetosiphonaceae bacterium]|nr:class I SAM-dependent methyltransferase [Herpetosiphonaceae bacterium]